MENTMKERHGAATFQGNPLTLLGEELQAGGVAPDFQVLDGKMAAVRMSAFKEKIRILVCVPSIDTPVCDAEVRKFNQLATQMGEQVVVLTMSMDLPFALDRWCGATHSHNIYTFSDHRQAEFGKKYGVLIKELRLLSRAVFVVDQQGNLKYAQYIKEITEHPDYESVIREVSQLV